MPTVSVPGVFVSSVSGVQSLSETVAALVESPEALVESSSEPHPATTTSAASAMARRAMRIFDTVVNLCSGASMREDPTRNGPGGRAKRSET